MDPESLVGRTLVGRFRIDRVLGRGGMATVFAAHDEKAGKLVALKVLKRELTKDPMVLRRFEREAKAASHLSHPNIIAVYDFGVDGGDAFISMELAAGVDLLKALSRERPMRQSRAVLLVAQVCNALGAAHKKGIIHRDLKPENVVLIPEPSEPGGERAKVLDFGIAKILDVSQKGGGGDAMDPPSYVTKTALTRVGTIVGTPAYMSPEQCRGGEVDGRSDVYACGVLLYQLVTGELPFTGETPLHTAMRHIHAQARPPSELRADLAPALEKTILKALSKWPGERHQSALALREELLALLPTLSDRSPELVLPEGFNSTVRVTPEPTRALVGGPLGSTPLRAVRLGGAPASEPLPQPTHDQPPSAAVPSTESAPRIEQSDDDDDEPRTFLRTPEAAERAAASASEPRTDPVPIAEAPPVAKADVVAVKTDPMSAQPSPRGNTNAPRRPGPSVTDVTPEKATSADPRASVPGATPLDRAGLGHAKTALPDSPATGAMARAAQRPRTLASARPITQRGAAAARPERPGTATPAPPPASGAPALRVGAGGAPLGAVALGGSAGPKAPLEPPQRRIKQTETGLTPTSPHKNASPSPPATAASPAPARALASAPPPPSSPPVDDDDEPSTNIRDVTGVGAHPLAGSEIRQVNKTLVMEETKARQHSAEVLGIATAPTALPPHAASAMHVPPAQPSPRSSHQSVPPPSASPSALKATARMAVDEGLDSGVAHVKSTMRMAHDHHPAPPSQPTSHERYQRLPASTWADPTSMTRRPAAKKGVTGFFDELPGTTGLIIGVGLGLGIAGGAILAFILLR
jgi:serine/threonine-protein kinase